MSCEQKREIALFLCIVTVAFYNFQTGDAISVGKFNHLKGFTASSVNERRFGQKNDAKHRHSYSGGRVILRGAPGQTFGLQEERAPSVTHEKPPIPLPSPNHSGSDRVLTPAWSSGNVSAHKGHLASDIDAGYQADFPGFKGHVVQGKVFGPAFDRPSPHFSEWLAMRPMVQCDDNIMTLTATGRGYTHLLVDRGPASPISLFQLPPYCGYSVKTSWRDLVMMAPYDGCYFTQENGSYVLPMLWWGSPLKLSCPVQAHPPALQPTPSVLCSPYGMAVQVHGDEGHIPMLGVKVNGEWAPFVSEECAYRVDSQPEQLIFFSFLKAPCVTLGNGVYFLVFLNRREFILSCPIFPIFPSPPLAPAVSPSVPPTPAPPPPPQLPTEGPMPQLPDYLNYLYPGLHYAHLHPPGPQSPRPGPQPPRPGPQPPRPAQQPPRPAQQPHRPAQQPPRPAPGGLLGHQSQQFVYHMGPGQFHYSPGGHLDYPSHPYQPSMPVQSTKPAPGKDGRPSQVPQVTTGLPQYPSGPHYPQVPNYYFPIPAAPTPAAQRPHGGVPPTIHSPKLPTSPPQLPKPAEDPKYPQYPTDQFYPLGSYDPYFPYGSIYYHQHAAEPGPDVQSSSSTAPPTTAASSSAPAPQQPVGPHYPPHPHHPPGPHYYPHGPMYVYPHAHLPSKGEPPSVPLLPQPHHVPLGPSVPTAHPSQRPTCPPGAHTYCSYYPHPLPHYHPPYPPHHHPHVPSYATPGPTSVLPTTRPAGTLPPPPPPSLHCQVGSMMVLLPSADPGSIQVRDHGQTWLPLSSVAPLCGYMLQSSAGSGVILYAPLPGCHSQSTAPSILSLPLRFWDLVRGQSRTLELQCPYVPYVTPTPGTLATTPPSTSTTPPSTSTSPPSTSTSPPSTSTSTSPPSTSTSPPSTSTSPPSTSTSPPSTRITQGTSTPPSTRITQRISTPPSTRITQGTSTPPSTRITQGTSTPPRPRLFCGPRQMTVELPPGPISGVAVKDIKGTRMSLQDAPEHCGYSASEANDGKIILNLPFNTICHMSVEGNEHRIIAIYMTVDGKRREARLSCPIAIPVPGQECSLPSEQRLPCGLASTSPSQCLSLGCCAGSFRPTCYYPMDECTLDRHFVFLVPASLTEPPLLPALLVAAGNSTCMPQKVTANYALFKIPLDGCGVRRLEVGKTVIYMVEVVNKVQTLTLNYGTITRDSPVRLLVECRYLPGSVVSVGYMVKSPSLGPSIHAHGGFGVQLRIATDAQYSSYLPQYHQPLQMLLGKPLHLEVRLLNPPDPIMVLLVHYCVAYPRSGQAVWVLLYNGCPNPLDPAPQQAVLPGPLPPAPQGQTRRFTINTFQFLSKDQISMSDEEIYFMCSTEVCSPLDSQCVEGCFGQ